MKKIAHKIDWIDIFKGILIIFMVIGHSTTWGSSYIYAFHMPAFFFISGYTTNYDKYDFISYFKHKFI